MKIKTIKNKMKNLTKKYNQACADTNRLKSLMDKAEINYNHAFSKELDINDEYTDLELDLKLALSEDSI